MRRLKQKNAALKGGETHSCSLDPSAIPASGTEVLNLRIDMLDKVLLQRDEMLEVCIKIIMQCKDKCEIQETQIVDLRDKCEYQEAQIIDLRKLNSNPRSDACSEVTLFLKPTAAFACIDGKTTPENPHAGLNHELGGSHNYQCTMSEGSATKMAKEEMEARFAALKAECDEQKTLVGTLELTLQAAQKEASDACEERTDMSYQLEDQHARNYVLDAHLNALETEK